MIDNKILSVLKKARKFVKGPKWSIPFSTIKAETRVLLLYQTAKKKIKQNKKVDLEVMAKRKEEAKISLIIDDIETINKELQKAQVR